MQSHRLQRKASHRNKVRVPLKPRFKDEIAVSVKWQRLCTNSHLPSAAGLLVEFRHTGWEAAGRAGIHSTCTGALQISWPVPSCSTMSPEWRFGFSILMVVGWSLSQIRAVSPLRARNVSWINLLCLWVSNPVLSLINTSQFSLHLAGLLGFRSEILLNQVKKMLISKEWRPGMRSTPGRQLKGSLSTGDPLQLTSLLKMSRKIAVLSFASPPLGTSRRQGNAPNHSNPPKESTSNRCLVIIYLNLACMFFNASVNILFEMPSLVFLPHSPFLHSGEKMELYLRED